MLNHQPVMQPAVIDLEMSDMEYLQLLAQGIDPVKTYCDQSYQTILMNYGLPTAEAQTVAPLFDKVGCSIEEKILVNQTLKRLWQQLIGQPAESKNLPHA